jgi:hypothetical protein
MPDLNGHERLHERMDNIYQRLECLPGIETELKGVNRRLDTINGKVADHELRIREGENKENQREGSSWLVKQAGPIIVQLVIMGIAMLVVLVLVRSKIYLP